MDPILRGFEIGGTLTYLAALALCLHRRSAYYLGIFFACNLLVFWDWIFNLKWFFNVSFNEQLSALWVVQGERETLAAALAFVGFYYWVFHLLTAYAGTLDRRFGRWQYPLIYVVSAVYVLAFEILFVHLGVWEYHQQAFFELYGVAWSNAWLNAHITLACYLLLCSYRRWGQVEDATGLRAQGEAFWKPFLLANGAVSTGFFFAFALQMIWYINAQPWTAGPRLF